MQIKLSVMAIVAVWVLVAGADVRADAPVVVVNRPSLSGNLAFDRDAMWTVIMAELESESELTLVDRAAFNARLDEIAMGEMELTRAAGAVRLGQLLGAHYFVNTRCSPVGDDVLVTLQAVEVATSRTYSGYRMAGAQELPAVARVAAEVAREVLQRAADADTAAPAVEQPEAPALPADAPRPRVAVRIEEDHVAQPAPVGVLAAVIIDPAAETEITKRLIDAAFPVVDLAFSAAMTREEGEPMAIAAALARAKDLDYLIYGEAISELGDRVGAFRGVRARVEIKAIDVATGRIIFSDSAYGSATDLSEAIGGKAALQAAANRLADRILPRLLEAHNEVQ